MRYLVTGANGFLGRHVLAGLAARGLNARAMIRRPLEAPLPGRLECVTGDLLDPSSLDAAVTGVTHVLHLASRVHVMRETAADPQKAFDDVNVAGTEHLLQAAARAGVTHFLLPSTIQVFAGGFPEVLTESSPTHPASPFARSKLKAEELVLTFAAAHGMKATVLRLAMVYGPGNKGNMMRLLEAAAAGRKLPFGCLHNRRAMLYVDHAVQAILGAIDCPGAVGEVFLAADREGYGTHELYAGICEAMGSAPLLTGVPVWVLKGLGCVGSVLSALLRRPMPVTRHAVRQMAEDLRVSIDKLVRVTGYNPTVELRDGLRATVEWYRRGCPPMPAGERV